MATSERLKMGTKLAFGVGAAGETIPYWVFNTFNMIFYNNALGLSGTLCGVAVMIALVADAISDPAIGFWSDRFRSRLGRRHPFMYAAPIPLAISFYLLYSPPADMGQVPLFLWFTFFTLAFRQAISLFQVPHLALGAELTNDYHQRTVLMAYSPTFGVVFTATAAIIIWGHFGKVPGGQYKPENFVPVALAVGLIAAAVIFISTHFTRDQIPRLRQLPVDTTKGTLKEFFVSMRDCLRNRNYAMLLLGLVFLSATLGIRETLGAHVSLFFWELSPQQLRVFGLVAAAAFLVAFFLAAPLHRRFDKRNTIMGSLVLVVIGVSAPLTLRLLGLFPPNGSTKLMVTLLCFYLVVGVGFAILQISVLSVLADVADEHELETGRRQEGMFYAARAFFGQVSSGLGHLLAGIALDVIAFPTGAKPGTVPLEKLTQLAWVDGPIGASFTLVAVFFYARFRIDKARHAEIQRELAARRSRAPEAPSAAEQPIPSTAGEALSSG